MRLTDEDLREIGRVTVAWSSLEWIVNHLLGTLVTDESWVIRRALLGDPVDIQLDRIAQILPGRIPSDDLPRFTSWLDGVRRVKTERNKIVHGVWGRAEDREEESLSLIRMRRHARGEVVLKHSVAEIRAVADETERLADEAVELLMWATDYLWPELGAYLSGKAPEPPVSRTPHQS